MTPDTAPTTIKRIYVGATWQEVTSGCSGTAVFRISKKDGVVYYLKIVKNTLNQEMLAEKERLEWLRGRLPVPTVLACITNDTDTYLLLSEIKGLMAQDERFSEDIPTIIRTLAESLRRVHQVDTANCPFDARLSHKIVLAQQRAYDGLVDVANFDEPRKKGHIEALLKRLLETQPQTEDLVFTHGDYCLPNILINPLDMTLSGFIDVGRAGIADLYQDLALAVRSIERNFGPKWGLLFLQTYGLQTVDRAKVKFYQLLDEFF